VVLGEVGAGRGELALVLGPLGGIEPPPRRIELQERELDVVALLVVARWHAVKFAAWRPGHQRLPPAHSALTARLCDNARNPACR
jgi:hypothetical protein